MKALEHLKMYLFANSQRRWFLPELQHRQITDAILWEGVKPSANRKVELHQKFFPVRSNFLHTIQNTTRNVKIMMDTADVHPSIAESFEYGAQLRCPFNSRVTSLLGVTPFNFN
jgi:hypothetical protein